MRCLSCNTGPSPSFCSAALSSPTGAGTRLCRCRHTYHQAPPLSRCVTVLISVRVALVKVSPCFAQAETAVIRSHPRNIQSEESRSADTSRSSICCSVFQLVSQGESQYHQNHRNINAQNIILLKEELFKNW